MNSSSWRASNFFWSNCCACYFLTLLVNATVIFYYKAKTGESFGNSSFKPAILIRVHQSKFLHSKVMAFPSVQETRPLALDAASEPPPLFDGTTRLYISYICPYSQRPWLARNLKGLQGKIKLVAIDLENRPAWYKEKVYPDNKVPSLEHNGKVMGESMDLVKYIDENFEGAALLPDDAEKRKFADEMIAYSDTFIKTVFASFKGGDSAEESAEAFDHLETALNKFDEGPFFLGELSMVDIAYIPFIERMQGFLEEVWKYDITIGRPNLAAWIQELNKFDAYQQTKTDLKKLVEHYKIRFMGQN